MVFQRHAKEELLKSVNSSTFYGKKKKIICVTLDDLFSSWDACIVV